MGTNVQYLQLSKPPARHILADDEDKLSVFQVELLRGGGGVRPSDLGDLCAHKTRHKWKQSKESVFAFLCQPVQDE